MTNKSDQAGITLLKLMDLEDGLSEIAFDDQDRLLMLNLTYLRDVIFIENMEFQVIYVSPTVALLFGYSDEEMKKLGKKDYMTPDSFARAMQSFKKYTALAQKQNDIDIPLMECEFIRKDGSTFWGELKVNFIRNPNGRLIGSQGILRDIDDRKKMEQCLYQSDYRFRTIFELSPQAIALSRLNDGTLVDVNEKFCELTKHRKSEIIGRSAVELGFYSEKMRRTFVRKLSETGELRSLDMDFTSKDGLQINAQIFARIIEVDNQPHILSVFYNKTPEKRLEQQFWQAQKMESIGTIAGGIAHDFNNFLMSIQGYVSVMLKKAGTKHPYHQMLCSISEQVDHCSQLTRQLLGYARKGKDNTAILDLNQLVDETAKSIKGAIKNINIHTELEPMLMRVKGDPIQIKQALYNLYINAADAMPDGGNLFLKTSIVTSNELAGHANGSPKKKFVSVLVADTGIGMDQSTLEHLFEPFFTTKEDGKGTGLGLTSAYGIVKGHGGYIDVESTPGKGTRFNMYFPAYRKSVKPVVRARTITIKPDIHFRTDGTVLFVDDDQIIREVSARMLETVGFRVKKASNGRQAIDIWKRMGEKIDLVILDLMMPDMNGDEVFKKIKKIDPKVKVLISSGKGCNERVEQMMKHGCLGFIEKPFNIDQLSQKIEEIFLQSTR